MPRPAAGDLPTSRTANLATRHCTTPASPATSPRKIATMSLPATHGDNERSISRDSLQMHEFERSDSRFKRGKHRSSGRRSSMKANKLLIAAVLLIAIGAPSVGFAGDFNMAQQT